MYILMGLYTSIKAGGPMPTSSFEIESLTEPGAHWLGFTVSQWALGLPLCLTSLPLPSPGLQTSTAETDILCRSQGSCLATLACIASALILNCVPQPLITVLKQVNIQDADTWGHLLKLNSFSSPFRVIQVGCNSINVGCLHLWGFTEQPGASWLLP